MLTTIQIKVPNLLSEPYQDPNAMEQSFYEDIILGEYQKGLLSIREAAEILGLTYEGFLEWLGERKISFISATKDELEQDYREFEQFMEQQRR
jgi:predicted HTH domain antitoxin